MIKKVRLEHQKENELGDARKRNGTGGNTKPYE
jgi:hypothetical protein